MIAFLDDLEELVDEETAATIAMRFSEASVQRALELADEGYEMTLEIGDNQIDHHYISMTLWDDGEIDDQIVIQATIEE